MLTQIPPVVIQDGVHKFDTLDREAILAARLAKKKKPRFNSKRARIRAELLARWGNWCFYCLDTFHSVEDITIDHYIPEAFGRLNGLPKILWNDISNMRLCCFSCNQLKASLTPPVCEYWNWLEGLSVDPRATEYIRTIAKQYMNRSVFLYVKAFDNEDQPLLDVETLRLDYSLDVRGVT